MAASVWQDSAHRNLRCPVSPPSTLGIFMAKVRIISALKLTKGSKLSSSASRLRSLNPTELQNVYKCYLLCAVPVQLGLSQSVGV